MSGERRSGAHRRPGLGPDARALIERARGGDEPSASDRARVRRALMASIAAGAVVSAAGTSAAASASAGVGSASAGGATIGGATVSGAAVGGATAVATAGTGGLLGLSLLGKVAAVVLAVSAGGAAMVGMSGPESASVSVTEPASASASVSVSPSAPEPAPAPVPVPVPDSDSASVSAPHSDSVSTPTRSARRARARAVVVTPPALEPAAAEPEVAAPPSRSTLAEETALVRDAWRALRDARHDDALRTLEAHRARFPIGALAPERDAARAIALCGAGRTDEGRRAVSAFLAEHPRSSLVTRVRSACP